jgi:hypothetical protein
VTAPAAELVCSVAEILDGGEGCLHAICGFRAHPTVFTDRNASDPQLPGSRLLPQAKSIDLGPIPPASG